MLGRPVQSEVNWVRQEDELVVKYHLVERVGNGLDTPVHYWERPLFGTCRTIGSCLNAAIPCPSRPSSLLIRHPPPALRRLVRLAGWVPYDPP